jgi:hypothetical protein
MPSRPVKCIGKKPMWKPRNISQNVGRGRSSLRPEITGIQ